MTRPCRPSRGCTWRSCRRPGRRRRRRLAADLEQGLLEVLRLVEEAVEDWQKMITRSEETIALLSDPVRTAGRRDEAALARELLGWLNANHFTFLGYREYTLVSDAADDGQPRSRFVPVPATGLGILRADADVPGAFGALPPASATRRPDGDHQGQLQVPGAPPGLPGLHRHPNLRRRGPDHRRAALPRPVLLLGLLRERDPGAGAAAEGGRGPGAVRLRRAEPWRQGDHGRAGDLPAGRAVPDPDRRAGRRWRRSPTSRNAVRSGCSSAATRTVATCPAWSICPGTATPPPSGKRMEDILLRRLGGASIDYTARVTESVLARLHFVVRMPVGEAMGEVDVRAPGARAHPGHPVVERRVRRH